MRNSRQYVVYLICLTLTAVFLAACGESANSSTPQPTAVSPTRPPASPGGKPTGQPRPMTPSPDATSRVYPA